MKDFTLKIKVYLDEVIWNESFGLRDFNLYVSYCSDNCDVCTSDAVCTTCKSGFILLQSLNKFFLLF